MKIADIVIVRILPDLSIDCGIFQYSIANQVCSVAGLKKAEMTSLSKIEWPSAGTRSLCAVLYLLLYGFLESSLVPLAKTGLLDPAPADVLFMIQSYGYPLLCFFLAWQGKYPWPWAWGLVALYFPPIPTLYLIIRRPYYERHSRVMLTNLYPKN